jgi:hypothetical protein
MKQQGKPLPGAKQPGGAAGGRMWVRLVRGHRAVRDLVVPCAADEPLAAFASDAYADLGMPVGCRASSDWKRSG